jgi:hypothetical protein
MSRANTPSHLGADAWARGGDEDEAGDRRRDGASVINQARRSCRGVHGERTI